MLESFSLALSFYTSLLILSQILRWTECRRVLG